MSSSPSNGSIEGSRTLLWCVPRAVSTAFAKCLSFIDDSEVWFEPYNICDVTVTEYKSQTNRDIPMEYEGNEEIFQTAKEFMDKVISTKFEPDRLSYGSVKRRLEATTVKHVFVKDMGVAMGEGYRQYLPKGYRHTFLIRNPVRSLLSYRKAMYKHFSELGFLTGEAANEKTYDLERDDRFLPPGCYVKELYDLWKYLKDEKIDPNPLVVDGDDLLTKPAETLSAYCNAVGLPYKESLLQWDGSPEGFKKMKAAGDTFLMDVESFLGAAARSSCFLPPSQLPPRDKLPADVIRCSDKVMKYFDEMYETSLNYVKPLAFQQIPA